MSTEDKLVEIIKIRLLTDFDLGADRVAQDIAVALTEAGLTKLERRLAVLTDAVGRYREIGPLKGVRAVLEKGYALAIKALAERPESPPAETPKAWTEGDVERAAREIEPLWALYDRYKGAVSQPVQKKLDASKATARRVAQALANSKGEA